MQPPDNLDQLKYESGVEKAPQASAFAAPSAIPHLEKRFLTTLGIFFVVILIAMFAFAAWPPSDFPNGKIIRIEKNSPLGQIANDLYGQHLIRSEAMLKTFVILFSGEKGIKAGDYLFSSGESIFKIAWRLVHGEEGLVEVKTTVPEGSDVDEISLIIGNNIPSFATSSFSVEAKPLEGYLFPDTYFFNQTMTPDDVIKAMRSLFDQKIATLEGQISAGKRATSSVVIMASMLEREATSSSDRSIIAGILWKRLDARMPLQVDATLVYALNKDGTKLTSADLAATSSFNTYKNLGLPPTPIGNPGLSAVEDAINSTATDYWYYISDSKGKIHYAKTYDEQLANERKYL